MKKQIIDLALADAVHFLEKANTSKTFKNITEKYIEKHNKGIFVNFSYNSSNAESLFKSLERKYSFRLDSQSTFPFSRDRVLKVSKLRDKVDGKKRKLFDRSTTLSKIEKSYHQVNSYLNVKDNYMSLGQAPENLEDVLVNAFHEGDALTVHASLLQFEKRNTQNSIKQQKKLDGMLQNIQSQTRYVEYELKHVDELFLKQVLKRYFASIEEHARKLFNTKQVYVIYSEADWIRKYSEQKNHFHLDLKQIGSLTKYETEMILFIEENAHKMFNLLIQHGEFSYSVGESNTSSRYKKYNEYPEHEAYLMWEEKLNTFQKENPLFASTIHLYDEMKHALGKESFSANTLLKYAFKQFPQHIIDEYNFILNEKETADKKRFEFKPVTKEIPSIVEAFSELKFEVEQKQDMNYWYASRKVKYNDIIHSISNDEYELCMGKVKKEEEEWI